MSMFGPSNLLARFCATISLWTAAGRFDGHPKTASKGWPTGLFLFE